MTFDLYAIALGLAATGFLLVSSICQNSSASGYVSTSIFAFATAVICAMNVVSIALTDVCEDDDDDDDDDNSTTAPTFPPGNNQTDTNKDDNDEYVFFCKYQEVFLAMSIMAATLWMLTGKFSMDISKLPSVQGLPVTANNGPRRHSNAHRHHNAFDNDQDGDTVASNESFEQQLQNGQELEQIATNSTTEHNVQLTETAIVDYAEQHRSSAQESSQRRLTNAPPL